MTQKPVIADYDPAMAFLGDGTMSEMTPLTLRAVFVPDESKKRRGFTGARCELPNGLVVGPR